MRELEDAAQFGDSLVHSIVASGILRFVCPLPSETAEHVRGNEQATRSSLIGPLFTLLGYDLTDPRQCIPEYKVDFGRERSVKPIDWAFLQGGNPLFFVEAKEAGRKLAGFDEQLADYFAKAPEAKLGILTNGVQWRFFTDLANTHVMDKEPFVKWDVLSDEQPPIEFLTILQKSEYNQGLLRTFAQRTLHQNLLIGELTRLLEPSPEFTKLAIANIETRNLVSSVVDSWKPVVANAISEWAKQRVLSSVIASQNKPVSAQDAAPPSSPVDKNSPKVNTTKEELDAFATIQRLLGPERTVAYEDTNSYFKIYVKDRPTWVMCRLQLDRRRPNVWIALLQEKLGELPASFVVTSPGVGWSCVTIDSLADLEALAPALRSAWDSVKSGRGKGTE